MGGDAERGRETITGIVPDEESDGLIVAKKRVTTVERRSPAEDERTQEKEKAAWLRTNTVRKKWQRSGKAGVPTAICRRDFPL